MGHFSNIFLAVIIFYLSEIPFRLSHPLSAFSGSTRQLRRPEKLQNLLVFDAKFNWQTFSDKFNEIVCMLIHQRMQGTRQCRRPPILANGFIKVLRISSKESLLYDVELDSDVLYSDRIAVCVAEP